MFYITGFRPFRGRRKNGSATLVEALRARPEFGRVHFRVLDVTWEGFDAFFREIQRRAPLGVIGLGEGKEPGIMIERVGRNIASGVDERGEARDGAPILAAHPATNASRLRVPPGCRGAVGESHDAGAFLCNYELYHLNTLGLRASAFIHLPPQLETADAAYAAALLPRLADIVRHNFRTE